MFGVGTVAVIELLKVVFTVLVLEAKPLPNMGVRGAGDCCQKMYEI